jgi:hypothetical protein
MLHALGPQAKGKVLEHSRKYLPAYKPHYILSSKIQKTKNCEDRNTDLKITRPL